MMKRKVSNPVRSVVLVAASTCFLFLLFSHQHQHGIQKIAYKRGFDISAPTELGLKSYSEESENCDLYEGKWVFDENRYPIYESRECNFIDGGFRCSENGRLNNSFTKWRWQPHHCSLPRFDAKLMLEKLRNKRLVFVGDSIGRNQWESMLCMLASAVANKSTIYEVNGNPITKHMCSLVFMFQDYNCTVEYYRAPFLVSQGRGPKRAPNNITINETLKLDRLASTSAKWKDAHVLVFNSGHWWTRDKTIYRNCYFQVCDKVMMNMTVEDALRHSIETLTHWVDRHVNTNKTRVFFRSYAPVHYIGGDWKNGGTCRFETMPNFNLPVSSGAWPQADVVKEVLSRHASTSRAAKLHLIDVTYMTHQRIDGHTSIYNGMYPPELAPSHKQDCSHWCLPGVPDTWNELLYALFLKMEHTGFPAS